MTILPAITTIERLYADALVAAERGIEKRIAARLDRAACTRLDRLTTEMLPGGISRFIWLRRIEPDNNSAAANQLLDRLKFLCAMNLDAGLLASVPPHRVTRLRRQGERYFADGLRDLNADRRRAIFAVCVIEWAAATADAVIETAAGWDRLDRLVTTARTLTDMLGDDPLAHADQGYHRFRRYAPRMLRCRDLETTPVARPCSMQ